MSILRAVSGTPRDAAERLAEESQGMILAVMSRKFSGLLADHERAQDAYLFAYVYLWRAAKRFDPARGLRFSTLAYRYIEGGLRRFMENERKAARLPVAALEEVFGEDGNWEEHLDGSSLVSTGRSWVSQEEDRLREDVRWQELMHGLPERVQTVLTLRYMHEQTFREIGDALGMTGQGAQNMEKQAAALFREKNREEFSPPVVRRPAVRPAPTPADIEAALTFLETRFGPSGRPGPKT